MIAYLRRAAMPLGVLAFLSALLVLITPARGEAAITETVWSGGAHKLTMITVATTEGKGIYIGSINMDCHAPWRYGAPAFYTVRVKLTAGDGTNLWERFGNIPGDCERRYEVNQRFPNRDKIEVFYSGFPVYSVADVLDASPHNHPKGPFKTLTILRD